MLYNGEIYLVNTKGKIQKANSDDGKDFDVENKGISDEDVRVKTNKSGKVQWISVDEGKKFSNGEYKLDKATPLDMMADDVTKTDKSGNFVMDADEVTGDTIVTVYSIELYDIYTYDVEKDASGYKDAMEGWLGVNPAKK